MIAGFIMIGIIVAGIAVAYATYVIGLSKGFENGYKMATMIYEDTIHDVIRIAIDESCRERVEEAKNDAVKQVAHVMNIKTE